MTFGALSVTASPSGLPPATAAAAARSARGASTRGASAGFDRRQRREQRVDGLRLWRGGRLWRPGRRAARDRFERARIAAALFHAGKKLFLFVGRHRLESLDHAALKVSATTATA